MKKIILVFVILIIAGLIISFRIEKKETVQTTLVTSAEVAKVNAILAKDADDDGLKDWEEELWKTDPANPDTDGDGTSDGEEITTGRNPLTAGPDDRLDEEALKTKVNQPHPEDETPTARFSREFFSRYLDLRRESGGKLPPEALAVLLQDAVTDAPRIAESKSFTATELSIINSSPETLHEYGNQLGTAVAEHSPEGLEDIFVTLQRSLEDGQEDELVKLTLWLDAYDGLIKRLLEIPVPAVAIETHLSILNASDGVRNGIKGIKNLYSDPLNVLPSITLFQESAKKLGDGFAKMQALFIRERIEFTPKESGYLIQELGV